MMRLLTTAILLSIAAPAIAEPQKADEHEKSADPDNKMICKRFIETGSLIKSYRACKIKRDWERERDTLRAVNNSNSCANMGSTGAC